MTSFDTVDCFINSNIYDEYGEKNPTKSKIRRKKNPLEFDRRDLARTKSKVAQRSIFLDCFGVFENNINFLW